MPSKSKATKISLTLWERIELVGSIVSQGRGVRDLLRASLIRKYVSITKDEMSSYGIDEVGQGMYTWPARHTHLLHDPVTAYEVPVNDKDIEYIRDCIRLMLSDKMINASPGWLSLVLKFFSQQELEKMADEIEPEKSDS